MHKLRTHSDFTPLTDEYVACLEHVSQTALKDVSIGVRKGETLLITGPSGSGKSTAMRVLAGIESPQEGTARLFGYDVGSLSNHRRSVLLSSRVGLGFQDPLVDKGLTGFENLVSLAEAFGRMNIKRAGALALRLELTDMLDKKAAVLSGGEKLRLALGRLLMPSPELLLLDEPTHMVDPAGKDDIFQKLHRIIQEEALTAVIISHDEEARAIAEREIVIHSGHAVSERVLESH